MKTLTRPLGFQIEEERRKMLKYLPNLPICCHRSIKLDAYLSCCVCF